MEIYAFGSISRGEIDELSDIDLLIIKNKGEVLENIDKEQFSIYTYERINEIWKEGNPFAWHLFSESKCIFSKDQNPFIKTLGKPNKYNNLKNDLDKFYNLFQTSKNSILTQGHSVDFDLSMIFLSIRNFASYFALGCLNKLEFSRNSALKIDTFSIDINQYVYKKLMDSRILSTRGLGNNISSDDLNIIISELPKIELWFSKLLKFLK